MYLPSRYLVMTESLVKIIKSVEPSCIADQILDNCLFPCCFLFRIYIVDEFSYMYLPSRSLLTESLDNNFCKTKTITYK